MHHMSSLGPEPPSLFSDCSAASLRVAAAHGCSNWSVKVPQVPLNIHFRCDPCLIVSFVCFLQYAMFLTLVFLAELVAGVSGFIFRHEVSQSRQVKIFKKRNEFKIMCFVLNSPDQGEVGGRL